MQQQLDRNPEVLKVRSRTVKHVFGTLKHWMGSTHFLMKGLYKVPLELGLHALAYNTKRVSKLLGTQDAEKAMRLARA